ncbi:unnamed protein product [Ectocarpus sp. 6 AP-2014]
MAALSCRDQQTLYWLSFTATRDGTYSELTGWVWPGDENQTPRKVAAATAVSLQPKAFHAHALVRRPPPSIKKPARQQPWGGCIVRQLSRTDCCCDRATRAKNDQQPDRVRTTTPRDSEKSAPHMFYTHARRMYVCMHVAKKQPFLDLLVATKCDLLLNRLQRSNMRWLMYTTESCSFRESLRSSITAAARTCCDVPSRPCRSKSPHSMDRTWNRINLCTLKERK